MKLSLSALAFALLCCQAHAASGLVCTLLTKGESMSWDFVRNGNVLSERIGWAETPVNDWVTLDFDIVQDDSAGIVAIATKPPKYAHNIGEEMKTTVLQYDKRSGNAQEPLIGDPPSSPEPTLEAAALATRCSLGFVKDNVAFRFICIFRHRHILRRPCLKVDDLDRKSFGRGGSTRRLHHMRIEGPPGKSILSVRQINRHRCAFDGGEIGSTGDGWSSETIGARRCER